MGIIDAHTHVLPQYAELAVRVMDRCGIDWCVTLEWHDGFGDALQEHLRLFDRYPGRFVVFGNVDWQRINEDGFAQSAAEGMAADAAAGMRGLKVYKALGLEYRHPDGTLWRVDDMGLDPIWAAAGRLGLSVLLHTADPAAFWQPLDRHNFWGGVLHGEYASWSYYRKGLPGRDELLAERNRVIRRHPGTTFICPHVGSRADSLDAAARDLEEMPNLYYDLSARIPIMGCTERDSRRSRDFLIQYQDRVLFGTDAIYDPLNVSSGMQAQCLYQPGQYPLPKGIAPEDRYVETTARFIDSHLQFLAQDGLQTDPPFQRSTEGFVLHNLNLPTEVVSAVLSGNALRFIGPPRTNASTG